MSVRGRTWHAATFRNLLSSASTSSNEPLPGSAAPWIQELMFVRGAELIAAMGAPFEGTPFPITADASPVESLTEQWLTPSGRSAIPGLLRDTDLYAQVVDATEPLYAEFEATSLMPMVHRVAEAIRATGSKQALFLETTMGSNMSVRSAIVPVELAGQRDPAQVYSPHGYDLVVNTPDIAQASPERVAFIFRRHGETAERLGMPMLVSEWGAYGDHPGTLPAAWHNVTGAPICPIGAPESEWYARHGRCRLCLPITVDHFAKETTSR